MSLSSNPGLMFIVGIPLVLALAITAPAGADVLIDCMEGNYAGDSLARAFYVPEYPGKSLEQVDMLFSSVTGGEYTIGLTARADTYDGAVLGTAEITIFLPGGHGTPVEGNFAYPNLRTTPGTTVTFTPEQITGPGTVVFWIGSSVEGCTVVETHSTNPPLDSERRVGIAVRILGEDGNVATETVSWGTIKGTFE